MLLEVNGLSVEFTSAEKVSRVVNDMTFSAAQGEFVGIVGESGSGKSTAVLATLGLVRTGGRIISGSVKFNGQELIGLSERELRSIRGAQIGLVMQNPRAALNPVTRVGDQISLVYRTHTGVDKDQARHRSLELLAMVGINDPERRLRSFPHELSGGMAQRVLLAMALACKPTLLIADEPTSGLDVTIQAQVLDDLRRAATELGSSALIVSQDLRIIANYCDRVYAMHAGEVVEEGSVLDFFEHPSHPVSLALLAAQSGVDTTDIRLRGFPVDPRQLPRGCWLHRRCPFADEAAGCASDHPALLQVADSHAARCHRAHDVHISAQALLDERSGTPNTGAGGRTQ
jgi:peptide/nickel transport system ATP-binding protein